MRIQRGGGLEKADAHRRCGKDRWTVGGAKAGESDLNGRGGHEIERQELLARISRRQSLFSPTFLFNEIK